MRWGLKLTAPQRSATKDIFSSTFCIMQGSFIAEQPALPTEGNRHSDWWLSSGGLAFDGSDRTIQTLTQTTCLKEPVDGCVFRHLGMRSALLLSALHIPYNVMSY